MFLVEFCPFVLLTSFFITPLEKMKISELDLDKNIVDLIEKQGITDLYPPQEKALPLALEGKNLVISIPTASGKSLIAYISIVNRLIKETGKALYVVPLKALAREKYEELKVFEKLGFKVGISTGDLDDSDPRLGRYDIIVCTSEKADSLLRHKVSWVNNVKVLVIDEIHLIHDPTRGPTLEVIISRFKALNPKTQIIALSATISNAIDLSIWLDGKLIESDWRPVPLREGVFYSDVVKFDDGKIEQIQGEEKKPVELLVEHSIKDDGQVLVFVNTRRSTVSVANRLARVVNKKLTDKEKEKLESLLEKLNKSLPELTSVDKKLFFCIKRGVSFHNAGLSSIHRRFIENNFKKRLIKCIVATPTLAAGVNIPAQRVIIRDLWRYDPNFGMNPIPILEYKQQAGRAGRPRYDKFGEAISIAKNRRKSMMLYENYILGDTEPIYSKLGSQAALRMHLLSSIATGFIDSKAGVYNFIDSTFYSHQSELYTLKDQIEEALNFLIDNGFVEVINEDQYMASLFGTRTSSLYIDPLSALEIKKALEESCEKELSELSFLHTVCSTPDVRSLYLRKSDSWVEEKADMHAGEFLISKPDSFSDDYEWFLSDLKTAFLVLDWINEQSEDVIVDRYNVGPGDIHNIVEMVQWLLHATREFARMYNFECVSDISDLLLRVQYGSKKELLNLVSLKGIGRIRARSLYNAGFKTINELRGVPIKRLSEVKTIGKGIAEKIKKQIGDTNTPQNKELSEFTK